MSDSATDDPTVTALLAMAEFFLTQRPLPVSEAAQCLLAVLTQQPVPRVEASVRLRLGILLSQHTQCMGEAKEHLEKVMLIAGTASNLQGVRFHAASSLASLLTCHGQHHQARGLLRGKLEATAHHPYWHIRLLLQLADLLSSEGDVSGQLSTLARCADYSHSIGASHTHLLVTLTRGAVLLTHHNYSEAGSLLNQASVLLETHRGPYLPLLRTFYLTIQVAHLLMAGQVKTAKPHLKQLQQCVQTLSSQPEERAESALTSNLLESGTHSADSFLWLSRPHAYIAVYLVSVLHSVQAGFTDKALSYVDRAMQLIAQESTCSLQPSGVLGVLRVHVLEQSVQCLLMRGETVSAATQLQDAVDTCHAHRTLVYSHRAVLHTLLGLYAFATGNLERAIAQFQTALQHTNCKELRILISLNLAISYMKVGGAKEVELAALMNSVNSDGANLTCQSLQSALSYVRGLFSFTCGRLHDAKRQLRETLTLANSSDLNKLTSCSLLLLGQIFLALGNTKETLDMVSPALQLAVKMPEKKLQVWAASLLADLYHTLGEGEKERLLRQQSNGMSQQLQQDEKTATGSRAHHLLQWTIGEWPATVLSAPEVRGQERGLEWPATVLSAPEVRGHERGLENKSGYQTPPRRSSMTLNGSPVTMKTPEIVLRKVESPSTATPPRSLLAMATKSQTTPTLLQAPPTHSRHVPSRRVSGDQPPTAHSDAHERVNERVNESRSQERSTTSYYHHHHTPGHQDIPLPNQDTPRSLPYQDTPCSLPNQNTPRSLHYQDTPRSLPNQDTPRSLPNQDIPRSLPYQDTPHSLPNQDTPRFLPNQDIPRSLPYRDTPRSLPNQDTPRSLPNQDTPRSLPNQDTPRSLPNQDTPRSLPNQDTPRSLPNQVTPRSLPNQDTPRSLPNQDTPRSLPNQDTPRSLPNQDTPRSLPNQDMSHGHQFPSPPLLKSDTSDSTHQPHPQVTPPLRPAQQPLLLSQITQHPSHPLPTPHHQTLSHSLKTHPSARSPQTHSSPTNSPHTLPSPHLPQYHHITPHQGHYVGQDNSMSPSLVHHHSPLHRAHSPLHQAHSPLHRAHSPLHQAHSPSLPSYEHSVHRRTPPSHPVSTPSSVGSPKLHHLSPSHTPPLSHTSPAHMDKAVEQHMLQTQQQLLWQQKYLQAQQNHQLLTQQLPHMSHHHRHHHPTMTAGLAPHYMIPSAIPAQQAPLQLQQISRDPSSRSNLSGVPLVMPSHAAVPVSHSSLSSPHILTGHTFTHLHHRHGDTHMQHHHGNQHR